MATAPAPPSPRFDRTVVVHTYNTIDVEEHEIVRLVTPYSGPYYFNILNLGPCTLYYRDDQDPDEHDEQSLTLPPSSADNMVLIPEGTEGLRLKVGPPCSGHSGPPQSKVSVRLVRG